jgi:hypothetical protein
MQVVDIPNSMTVLPELLPYSLEMVCVWCVWCGVCGGGGGGILRT